MRLCRNRKLLYDTPGGQRVNLGRLFGSFTHRERCRWDRWSGVTQMDDHGILPEGVEAFLESLETKVQGRFV